MMDEEIIKKTCIKEKEKRGDTHQPFYGTWVMDFMLRQDAGGFVPGKYLSDQKSKTFFLYAENSFFRMLVYSGDSEPL